MGSKTVHQQVLDPGFTPGLKDVDALLALVAGEEEELERAARDPRSVAHPEPSQARSG